MIRFTALVALACLLSPLPSSFCQAKPKAKTGSNTLEDLLRPPRLRSVTLSPDGRHAAGLAPINAKDGEQGLAVIDLDTMKVKRSFRWRAEHDIYDIHWLNDRYLSFNVSKWDAFVSGVYRFDIERNRSEPLLDKNTVARIMDPHTDHPTNAWVWIQAGWQSKPSLAIINKVGSALDRSLGGGGVYPTNVNPLLSMRIPQPLGDVFWWYIDWTHTPRIISHFRDGVFQYLHRNGSDDDWQPLPLDPEEWTIALFSPDNRQIYVAGYDGHDTKGLYLYDLDTGQLSEPLFRDNYYDFSETASYMTYRDRLLGIHYDKSGPTMVWFAPEMEAIQRTIDSALPGKANIIYDWSDDFARHLIYSFSDTHPPSYALLDLLSRELTEITPSRPWLDYEALAKTEVFHFNTADGLRLEGYLTRPAVGSAPYPTICLVHGGPWVRDFGSYNDEVQALAARGYAVLRVNFRGSTGYGKRISFEPAYDFRRMHEDITEAVRVAVKAGIADETRLAIMGASFGGYAAMCGAAFEPDLYRCAITNMGVFDWEEMVKDRKRQRHRYSHHKLLTELGDPKEASDRFEAISPIHHIDKVKIPIFVIHGRNDKNVSIRQSKDLVAALRKAEVEHEVMFVAGEGHNIFELKRRVELYERISSFLAKHLQ